MSYLKSKIYRFKVVLLGSDPEIWREIDVPESYNFWDLHVAIQDAMGWFDYHMHEFIPNKQAPTKGKPIGIPEQDADDSVVADWEVPVKKYFTTLGHSIRYDYDFGNGWQHEITLVAMFLQPTKTLYPLCYAGERACPPEDCGGILGYQNLLDVIGDPKHSDYEETVEWLQGHVKNYWPYKPDKFSAKRVKFSDPYKRWCIAFDQPYDG